MLVQPIRGSNGSSNSSIRISVECRCILRLEVKTPEFRLRIKHSPFLVSKEWVLLVGWWRPRKHQMLGLRLASLRSSAWKLGDCSSDLSICLQALSPLPQLFVTVHGMEPLQFLYPLGDEARCAHTTFMMEWHSQQQTPGDHLSLSRAPFSITSTLSCLQCPPDFLMKNKCILEFISGFPSAPILLQ